MSIPLFVVITAVGTAGTLGQIMVLREFLVLLHGQELSTGLVLASWLGWTACGGYLIARLSRKHRYSTGGLTGGVSALALLLPVTILWIRATRLLWGLPPGESLDLWATFAVVLTATGPFCLVNGALFAIVWGIWPDDAPEVAFPPLPVYLAEALGAALGGLLFTFVLLPHFPVLEASLLVSLGLVGVGGAFLWGGLKGCGARNFPPPSNAQLPLATLSRWERAGVRVTGGGQGVGDPSKSMHSPTCTPSRRRGNLCPVVLLLSSVLLLAALWIYPPLEEASRLWQWGAGLRAVRDTPFGNLALLEREGQFTLFANGLWAFSAPDPQSAEEGVHVPLLVHPNPRRVLLVGGVTGGAVGEILKHPSVEILDGVEPDPEIFRLGEAHLPSEALAPLHDPRVRLHTADAGRWVRTAAGPYDVVLLNVGEPLNIGMNRFYTVEFFRRVRRLLPAGGLFSLAVPYSPDVLGAAQVGFLRSLQVTLQAVFPAVVVAGGNHVRFLASSAPGVLDVGVDELTDRLAGRNLSFRLQYIREDSLWDAFNPFRLESLKSLLADHAGAPAPVNSDWEPVSAFHSLLVWSVSLHPHLARVLERIAAARTLLLGVGWALLGVAALWVFRASRAGAGQSVRLAVAVNGGTLMAAEIMLLVGFQTLEGYVYRELALIVSAFMAGMALGAAAVSRVRAGAGGFFLLRLLAGCQVALAVLMVALPVGLRFFGSEPVSNGSDLGAPAAAGVFCLIALLAGALGGSHFALAVRVTHLQIDNTAARRSGPILYAWDLLGAAAGAILCSVFLLPLFGIPFTSWNMAAVNGLAALLLFRQQAVGNTPE